MRRTSEPGPRKPVPTGECAKGGVFRERGVTWGRKLLETLFLRE